MERWESIIAQKMRPCAKLAEDVAHQRKLEYERKREATPERRAQHRAYDKSERGREVCREKSRRWYAAHKKDPAFMDKKRDYNRNYRAMRRAQGKVPSIIAIMLQDIGYMTVHLVRSSAA